MTVLITKSGVEMPRSSSEGLDADTMAHCCKCDDANSLEMQSQATEMLGWN